VLLAEATVTTPKVAQKSSSTHGLEVKDLVFQTSFKPEKRPSTAAVKTPTTKR
jgi:hypothetical protein